MLSIPSALRYIERGKVEKGCAFVLSHVENISSFIAREFHTFQEYQVTFDDSDIKGVSHLTSRGGRALIDKFEDDGEIFWLAFESGGTEFAALCGSRGNLFSITFMFVEDGNLIFSSQHNINASNDAGTIQFTGCRKCRGVQEIGVVVVLAFLGAMAEGTQYISEVAPDQRVNNGRLKRGKPPFGMITRVDLGLAGLEYLIDHLPPEKKVYRGIRRVLGVFAPEPVVEPGRIDELRDLAMMMNSRPAEDGDWDYRPEVGTEPRYADARTPQVQAWRDFCGISARYGV